MSHPLVVDLDGTLLKTDLLFETACQFAMCRPWRWLYCLTWLMKGIPHLKAKLAEATKLEIAHLPRNETVVAWLKAQKATGRCLVLATASDRRLAEQVASRMGLFDEVFASDGQVNLRGKNKRDALVQRFGEKQFDYVGDSLCDVPVWAAAEKAYVVSDSKRVLSRALALGNVAEVFPARQRAAFLSVIKALRPHQWLKNILCFVPLITSHAYQNQDACVAALSALLIFSVVASSVYVLNDLVDVRVDRHHVRKRYRVFAAAELSLLQGWLLWPSLLGIGLILAFVMMPMRFLWVLSGYYLTTLAYSFYLKRKPALDVLTLAGLYTLRIIAGAAAIVVPVSFWLLAFSMFFFLSLAFVKRYSELYEARQAADEKRIPGRGYHPEDLVWVSSAGMASGYLSVLVLALYMQDSRTSVLYDSPGFIWFALPLLLYWLSRTWLIAHRGNMHDDPVVFAVKDKVSWCVAIGFILAFILARFMS